MRVDSSAKAFGPKMCEWCGKPYHKSPKTFPKQWKERRFCSISCSSKHHAAQMRGEPTGARAAINSALSNPLNRGLADKYMRRD